MTTHFFVQLYWPKDVGPVGHGSPAAPRRLWVRSLVGTNFRLRVKKPPRLPHVQSTVKPGLTHKATGPVYGWGRGSGVFLACCEKVILPLKQCRGGGLTPRRSSFFLVILVGTPPYYIFNGYSMNFFPYVNSPLSKLSTDRFLCGAHKDMNCEKWYKYNVEVLAYGSSHLTPTGFQCLRMTFPSSLHNLIPEIGCNSYVIFFIYQSGVLSCSFCINHIWM